MNPYDRRESPEVEEQLRAEAEECRNLTNMLGLGFRPLQHEAYERWAETFDVRENDLGDANAHRPDILERRSWNPRLVSYRQQLRDRPIVTLAKAAAIVLALLVFAEGARATISNGIAAIVAVKERLQDAGWISPPSPTPLPNGLTRRHIPLHFVTIAPTTTSTPLSTPARIRIQDPRAAGVADRREEAWVETETALPFNQTPAILNDFDGDGVPDHLDQDKDNDGIPDYLDGNCLIDSDLDGFPDCMDLDSDGDGVWDLIEGNDAVGAFKQGRTPIGDGKNDHGDHFDKDNNGQIDADEWLDANNNGWHDYYEAKPPALQDTDGDGTPDIRDADDDNDAWFTDEEDRNTNGLWWDDDMDCDGVPDYLDAVDDTRCQ